MVTAVAHGAATISVTVNGVTGTTPIVVQQPFTLTAPPVVTPGSAITVTTALPAAGSKPLSECQRHAGRADGWTATATSPSTFATVQPGQTAQTTWAVTVPAGATPGSNSSPPPPPTPTPTDGHGDPAGAGVRAVRVAV